MNKYELIDKMIREYISGYGREPNLITMHPNAVKLIIKDVKYISNINIPLDGNYKNLKYRGIRVVRTKDIEEDAILVSRTNTN